VRISHFFCARLSGEHFDERRLAIHQEVQGGVDGVQIVEGVEAVGARAEFAGRLGTSEQEDADQGDLVAVEIEYVGKAMLEFGDAAVGSGGPGETFIGERMEGAADSVFVELHDRFAVRFLVGGVLECVQGERVVIRRGDFFFDEAAEDPGFGGGEVEVHLNMIHDGQKRERQRRGEMRRAVLSRGDLLHELSEIERGLSGFDAQLRQLQWEARGDLDDFVGVGLFHPPGADLAQDAEHQGARANGFDVCAGAAGFLQRAGIDCDRREIVR
jgi:hypothetical protein